MIDLHCHILPGLDDGADSWETALEMGRMAAEAGTVTVAATCHYLHPSSRLTSFGTDFEWAYREKRERLQAFFEKMKINLTLASGAEIFAGEDFLSRMGREPLPTLNGTRCLLVETPPDAPAFFIYRLLDRLLEMDYLPLLAHPERYLCAQRMPAHLYEWYRMGAMLQVNKGSVYGAFGSAAQRAADAILRHRLAAVAASDAHSAVRRTPRMDSLYQLLAEKYGPACPELLLRENPRRILEGRRVIWEPPIPFDYDE